MNNQRRPGDHIQQIDEQNLELRPIVGLPHQPVIGQPINQYQPQQQVIVIQTPITNPLISKESTLSQYVNYFYCGNWCVGALSFIIMMGRLSIFPNLETGMQKMSETFIIISDVFFLMAAYIGLNAIQKKEYRELVKYQKLIGISFIFHLISSMINMMVYNGTNYNNVNPYKVKMTAFTFILVLAYLISIYGFFILLARKICILIIDIEQTKLALQNQQAQMVNAALQRQGVR